VELKDADVLGYLKFHDGRPTFSLVEFNIWGACNRRCEFCPISDPEIFTNVNKGVSEENYSKVLTDLGEIGFTGVILWSMFSEPLLHKSVLQLAKITKSILPQASLQLTSNGDVLIKHPDRLKMLFDAGVDRVNLSLYDGPEQFVEFTRLRKEHGLSPDQIKLRRRYLDNGNYGISISNRTGIIDSNKYRAINEQPVTSLPLNRPCYYPFYQVAIDYNGDVLLCPHDWGKKLIAGNAFIDNIWKIWTGQRFEAARSRLSQCERSFAPCNTCDVAGDLIGKENFLAFQKS